MLHSTNKASQSFAKGVIAFFAKILFAFNKIMPDIYNRRTEQNRIAIRTEHHELTIKQAPVQHTIHKSKNTKTNFLRFRIVNGLFVFCIQTYGEFKFITKTKTYGSTSNSFTLDYCTYTT